jgi:hypothetical protein
MTAFGICRLSGFGKLHGKPPFVQLASIGTSGGGRLSAPPSADRLESEEPIIGIGQTGKVLATLSFDNLSNRRPSRTDQVANRIKPGNPNKPNPIWKFTSFP